MSTVLDDVWQTIARRRTFYAPAKRDIAAIEKDCAALLRLGPDAGKRVAQAILETYAGFSQQDRRSFFRFLADGLDLDPEAVVTAAARYRDERSPAHLEAVLAASEPQRQMLLRRLNALPGATAEIVAMRADLLALLPEEPDLARVDLDFAHLFASWFNRGFLELRRISWDSSAAVLAKIIAYEAVHEINGWNDLRSRLQQADRRCYAFFHPAMPGEPLVFTELALVRGVPDSVQRVLDENREEQPAAKADTAVFYSISNCQAGLRGVSFGNLLIKQVVADLARELPNLKTYVTLSPLPGFARWLAKRGPAPEDPAALTAAAAHYLSKGKRSDGQPIDPVARFHLANGARIEAVHAGADTSPNGAAQSHGVMVNYLYDLSEVEANQEAFAASGTVATSRSVRSRASAFKSVEPERLPKGYAA